MKVVKFCLLPLLVLVTLPFIIGFFFPDGWDVEVSTQIAAPPEVIHPWVEDLRRWEEWVTLGEGDSKFVLTYEGEDRGVGAIATSKGPGSNVRWEITASDPQKGVWFDEFLEQRTPAKGAIMFEAQGNTTKVTWVDKGTLGSNPALRLFHPLMQSSLTVAFQRNLESLKAKIEAPETEAAK